jgi:WD40 repeat protein
VFLSLVIYMMKLKIVKLELRFHLPSLCFRTYNMELVSTLSGHVGRAWNVKWHPTGSMLASCGEDKSIRLWAGKDKDWSAKAVLEDGHEKSIREVSWSPCGKYLASAGFDATTAIWDNISGEFECNATLEGHENEVKSVSWSPSGAYLATCSRDKSVWVWELEGEEYECAAVLSAHSQDVKRVVWHPQADLIASASYDNTVKMFKEDPVDNEWTNFATLKSHESTVWSLCFDSTGSRLASCSDDRTLKIWKEYLPGNPEGVATDGDDPSWKCVCTLGGYHLRTIYDVAWSHHNNLIATACADNAIRIFREVDNSDPHQPEFDLVHTLYDAHGQDVNSVAWHPTQHNLIASASDDSTVKIWNLLPN